MESEQQKKPMSKYAKKVAARQKSAEQVQRTLGAIAFAMQITNGTVKPPMPPPPPKPKTPPPPLPLLHMDEIDLSGVLFVNFPTGMEPERSRLVLEQLVRRCGFVELSPATIYTALAEERRRNFMRLPEAVRRRKIDEAWAARRKRPPKPLPKIKIEDWSF